MSYKKKRVVLCSYNFAKCQPQHLSLGVLIKFVLIKKSVIDLLQQRLSVVVMVVMCVCVCVCVCVGGVLCLTAPTHPHPIPTSSTLGTVDKKIVPP